MPKKKVPAAEKWDVNVNLTVVIPKSEVQAIKDEAEMSVEYEVEQFLESNLDVGFPFGDAWICSVDQASYMEDA
jgi:hypothetical protein